MSEGFLYQLLYQFAKDPAPKRSAARGDESSPPRTEQKGEVSQAENRDRRIRKHRI